MGMYDTFIDADGSTYQTKAFGRRLAYFRIGDPAPVRRAPFTEAEFNAWLDEKWDGDPGPGAQTCQVEAGDGVLLSIRDGMYVGTSRERDPALPLFDYHGRNVTDLVANLADPVFAARYAQAGTLAWSHLTAIGGAYRAPSLAGEYNEAVASLMVHCEALTRALPDEVHEPAAWAAHLEESRRESERLQQAEQQAKADAGFGDYDPATATEERKQAFWDWCMQQSRETREERRREREQERFDPVPKSRFVLGHPAPTRPQSPLSLQEIADVFMRALAVVRDAPEPEREPGSRRRMLPSGAEVYARHVEEYRKSGLHVVGPGWASTARVHQSS